MELFKRDRFNYYPNNYLYTKMALKSHYLSNNVHVHQDKKQFFSPIEFKLKNNLKFGISPLMLRFKLGKPFYSYERDSNYKYKILLYKSYIGKYKTKVEYHFFDKKLFFVTYTFSESDNFKTITSILKNKYKIGKNISIEDIKIIDKNKNIIYVDKTFDFTINYLTGDNQLIQAINEKIYEPNRKFNDQVLFSNKILFDTI